MNNTPNRSLATSFCVVAADGNRGRVLSRHRTAAAAFAAETKLADAVLRRTPNAITHLMYAVIQSDAAVGARVRLSTVSA